MFAATMQTQQEISRSLLPAAVVVGGEMRAAGISPPAIPANMRYGIVPFTLSGERGIAALAM
ncbi:hypothetical protein BPNPMPFG_007155 (plasmid) [Mesorhizobium sp. AR07]|uniref:hypothetical protein n=1 Tax=Mesorhizobium sp. AR07 TaxID=2865838 RepID=UPI00215EC62D|nr:hypothetical protein [Mesorhizobium sp. AR07]UVK48701.1 hypothetical protein BPNPMPFG_007146 [Mesorhizobium sp. AR07]UVK48707.1 hypothetical protein BPNPMPFG_007155 [Mesorhizobium sp. AR07]